MANDQFQFTGISPIVTDDPNLRVLHTALRRTDEAWRGAKAWGLDYDVVRELATDHIHANYEYQKARFGKIVNRMAVEDLIR